MADSASGSNPNPSSSDSGAAPPRDERSQLAHEMRNALSPLRTSLELLRLPQMADTVKDEARAIMARQIDRLSQLIDRLAPRGAAPPRGRPPPPRRASCAPGGRASRCSTCTCAAWAASKRRGGCAPNTRPRRSRC